MAESTTQTQAAMPKRIFLVDSENGIETLIDGCERLNKRDTVIVFHRNSVSKKVLHRLNGSRAQIEWIECIDPGIKDSMDFQIVTELCLRLAQQKIDEVYIISRDNGFDAAVHYLQQKLPDPPVLLTASNIYQALYESLTHAFDNFAEGQGKQEILQTLTFFLGNHAAELICKGLSKTPRTYNPQNCKPTNKEEDEVANFIDEPSTSVADIPDSDKLTNLKGIGNTLSHKLQAAGIDTVQKLKDIGAVEAWQRIHAQDATFLSRWVYTLEAAILDKPLTAIGPERRKQLQKEIE